jgi:hypothetical protein
VLKIFSDIITQETGHVRKNLSIIMLTAIIVSIIWIKLKDWILLSRSSTINFDCNNHETYSYIFSSHTVNRFPFHFHLEYQFMFS